MTNWDRTIFASVYFFYIYALSHVSASQCDAECPVHRLVTVGLPIANGTKKIYWWPQENEESLSLTGEGLYSGTKLQDSEVNQWHEIEVTGAFTDDLMVHYLGRHGGGGYTVLVPSLNISEEINCDKRRCAEVDAAGTQSSWWAVDCKAPPCGCPSSDAQVCKGTEKIEPRCSEIFATSLGVPLNSPSKVFWRPKVKNVHLEMLWGTTRKWTNERWKMKPQFEHLFTWIEVDIRSRLVPLGDDRLSRKCDVSVRGWSYERDCSVSEDADNKMLFMVSVPSTFALGCSEEPKEIKTASPVQGFNFVILVIVFAVIIMAVPLILIICSRMRKKRRRRVTRERSQDRL